MPFGRKSTCEKWAAHPLLGKKTKEQAKAWCGFGGRSGYGSDKSDDTMRKELRSANLPLERSPPAPLQAISSDNPHVFGGEVGGGKRKKSRRKYTKRRKSTRRRKSKKRRKSTKRRKSSRRRRR